MDKKNYQLPSLKLAKVRTRQPSVIERQDFDLPVQLRQLGEGRYFYIRTYGCQANERDSDTISGIMSAMGYTQTEEPEQASVLIFNTCAIRKNAENKVFGEIGAMKRLKKSDPDRIFALCGCMAQEEDVIEQILNTYRQIDIVFGTHNIHRLPELLYEAIESHQRVIEVYSKEGEVIENLPVKRFGQYKAWVNIMYGCNKFCTYCIVPYTRGKERSRMMDDIIAEVKELKESGYREVTLLGQNVNAYGKDLGMDDGFALLLEEVAKTGIERIRFSTSHPRDYTSTTIDVMQKYPNIMPALHLPVQSGNNEVLKRMGRGYTVEHYKELFDDLKRRIPSITFSTDIIVGFPGETREQFEDTLALVDYCKYDLAYTFVFSPRVGTPAASMEDNMSEEEKKQRLYELNEHITRWSNENNQRYLNKVVKVLVDGLSKTNDQVYSGYSEENKLVNFKADHVQEGDIVDVLITEVRSYSLNGEAVEK